jgi:phosphoribosylformimino-5-aminoimidazole carboxamide ribotide isomerase
MNLYPAIDILEGSAVRLVKGDFDAKKVYDEDPLDAAGRRKARNTCTWSTSTARKQARR